MIRILASAVCIATSAVLSTVALEATTLIAFRSHDEVVIAADSRLTRTPQLWGCKIMNFGDVVLAATGAYTSESFSLPELAELLRDTDDSQPVVVRIANFAQKTRAAFTEAKPELDAAGRFSLTYLLGFFEQGIPIIQAEEVHRNGEVVRLDDRIQYTWAGESSLFNRQPHTFFTALQHEMGLYSMLNLLIGLQARAFPTVGLPVDIIRLTAGGPEWVQKKRECRERE